MTNFEKVETGLIIITLIGFIFLINDLPGGALVFSLASATLAMCYYPLGFLLFNRVRIRKSFRRESYDSTNAKRIIGSIAVGLVLSIIIVGTLFKLMVYPGAEIMLSMGLTLSIIVFGLSLFGLFRNRDWFYKGVVKRMVAFGLIGILLYAIPISDLIDFRFRNDPERRDLMKEMIEDPNNPELQEKWQELHENEEN